MHASTAYTQSHANLANPALARRREALFLQKKLGRSGRNGRLSCLIIDEAQQIKNSESARNKHLSAVEADHRLLLTGTPVENSPRELLTLLSFLMPRLFGAPG